MTGLTRIHFLWVILFALFVHGYGCSVFSSPEQVHLAYSKSALQDLQMVAVFIDYDVERDYHKARSGSREALGLYMADLIAENLKEKVAGIEIVDIPGGKEMVVQDTLPHQLGREALEKFRSPYGLQDTDLAALFHSCYISDHGNDNTCGEPKECPESAHALHRLVHKVGQDNFNDLFPGVDIHA